MSTDYGLSWTMNSGSVPSVYALTVRGGMVYASSESGIYKSTDGLNYTLLPRTDHWKRAYPCPQTLHVEKTSPHTLLVATTEGLFRSTDGGSVWTPSNGTIQCGNITALRVVPDGSGVVFASRAQDAVYKTSSSSAVPFLWERLPEFYSCELVQDIAILPADPNVIFAMEGGG
jgi:hypothetical protein